jgi:mono/diheme cytochrome c family protein
MRKVRGFLSGWSSPFALCLALATPATAMAAGIDNQDFNQVERGRYLTIAGDCAACHTLPGSGHDFAGGRIIETPFGNLLTPNITPDPVTGIGAWTDDEFVDALTEGNGRNGEHLFPAMPYTYYTKMTRADALAIRAYLNTIPAVHHDVDVNQLPFPLNLRTNMAVWNKLFFKPGTFKANPKKTAQWNRGAYLVQGLEHCGLCHTPKNLLGGDKTTQAMQGYNLQGWFAPNITNDPRRGLGRWSTAEIADFLKYGHNNTSNGSGPMSEAIHLSTSRLTDDDIMAIAIYLKDQPGDPAAESNAQNTARPATVDADPDPNVMKIGAQIYADECSGCHTPDGRGVPGLFPSLNGTPSVQQIDPASLMHVVLRGALSVATSKAPTSPEMPAFAWVLNDEQIAAVLTYIRNTWGNSAPAVNASDVAKARRALAERDD